ncbi:malto-oligosyltrehalose synthase [Vulcaniibacterium thermophilum]|uniref:Malto-oligosyltrehalose synthase n=1 Tax=Vulcaniibacterium thermophilum TaxID=1169913 RepID=A0A919DH08_9GAMM|nr:malto-oligosyltrehalose synthase [Vulcaniibacterium thermophilum]GHE42143.1 malto-oligosyltrehalose synthase [Vulcaniibacterium thermophilum]
MTPLRATVRLQLHRGFDLDAAAAQVPYYAALGISHYYLSPIGVAMPGSSHGYDVIDPTRVNPELGGEDALRRLAAALRAHGMGLILDIVPNHMAAHAANPWWRDVLRHGRGSRYARFFDIDWHAPGCAGRLILPVLDRPCAQALREGVLALAFDEATGEAVLDAGQPLPLRLPDDAPREPAALRDWIAALNADAAEGGTRLAALIDAQAYRPLWWRLGHERINYRRFFDISSLAALRVEREDVFKAVHALPLRLIAEGLCDGLRVDHVDGLAAPRAYCRRLRARMDEAAARRGLPAGSVSLHVEKILAADERLRRDWRTDGTTGYDFMDQVGALLHDPDGEAELRALWQAHAGRSGDFHAEERAARRELLEGALLAERERAVAALCALAAREPDTREFGRHLLARALCAGLERFPVYRTYARDRGLDRADARVLARAWSQARAHADPALAAALDAIERWMREDARAADPARRRALRRARRRIEQLAAPLNAKAVEDTAFYRHGVLLSRNEVGADPSRFALEPARFHALCRARARRFPRALLATATHDHKRGEDVRARLAVLSERPQAWRAAVERWLAAAAPLRTGDAPSAGDRLMLLQTLVGAWPPDLRADDGDGLRAFAERIVGWQRKALREAKLRSGWTHPDEDYEAACERFARALLTRAEARALREDIAAFVARIAPAGAVNGLAQCLLRTTVPGVPDLYQGGEGWDFSLVDPDNRRPVDHALRRRWLDAGTPPARLLRDWRTGAVKQALIAAALALRARHPDVFAHGRHRPLAAAGAHAGRVLAFVRAHRGVRVAVAVPRLGSRWFDGRDDLLVPAARWADTRIALPAGRWRDPLAARELRSDGACAAADLFASFPVALLIADTDA